MRKTFFVIITILIVLFSISKVYADNFDDITSQIQGIDTSEIDSMLKGINENNGNIIPVVDIKTYISNILSGKENFSFKDILNNIFKLAFKELLSSVKLLIQLLIIAIIGAILTNIQGTFERNGVSQISFMAVYMVIVIVAIKSFTGALAIGREAIDNMINFIQAMLPVLITMLVSVGAVISASFFQPSVIVAVEFIAQVMKDFVLPAVLFMTAIKIVGNISEKISLNKMADFLKTVCTATMSILLSIFLGVITVQGLTSSMADGVVSRTAKYTVGTFLPVVGGLLSDSIDAILGASFLIKSAVSSFGLIAIIIITIMPSIKLLALMLIYKLSAALVEPISDKRIVNCISDMATSITFVFAVLISVTVMIFFGITAIIGAASVSVMMR